MVRKVSLIMNVFMVLFRWSSGPVRRGSRFNGIQIVLTGQPQSSGVDALLHWDRDRCQKGWVCKGGAWMTEGMSVAFTR